MLLFSNNADILAFVSFLNFSKNNFTLSVFSLKLFTGSDVNKLLVNLHIENYFLYQTCKKLNNSYFHLAFQIHIYMNHI
jgi:hypothetical protein